MYQSPDMNAQPSNIIEFPAAMKCFKHTAWNGKIAGECSTTPFRRCPVNPDPAKFVEVTFDEMKSARGTAASVLWTEAGVQIWGWL
jgi:hypothetical protein